MLVLDHNTASLRAYPSIEKCVRLDKDEVMGVFLFNWVPKVLLFCASLKLWWKLKRLEELQDVFYLAWVNGYLVYVNLKRSFNYYMSSQVQNLLSRNYQSITTILFLILLILFLPLLSICPILPPQGPNPLILKLVFLNPFPYKANPFLNQPPYRQIVICRRNSTLIQPQQSEPMP